MADEFEAVGALASVGLAVNAFGRETGKTDDHEHPLDCANCGSILSGPYCHECGQRGHVHRSLVHMGEEMVHGIAHFDGKIWKTLPLLAFKPGVLTREYIHGKRARYVSPMALFLFVVFVMFLVFSFGHTNKAALEIPGSYEATPTIKADFGRVRDEAKKDLGDKIATGRSPIVAAETVAAWESASGVQAPDKTAKGIRDAALPGKGKFVGNTGIQWIDDLLNNFSDNPELTLYKLKNTAYKFSFLLVPISLPFIWLLFFWRRDVKMYDHAVFALYSLSFMSMLFTVAALASNFDLLPTVAVVSLICFVPPIHMYKQLKYAYGLGRTGAAVRTFLLLIFTTITLSLFASAILALGLHK